LIINAVGSHADQYQIASSLTYDFVTRREWDEMRKPLESDRIAITHRGPDGLFEVYDVSQDCDSLCHFAGPGCALSRRRLPPQRAFAGNEA
jgi:hypothetical protein